MARFQPLAMLRAAFSRPDPLGAPADDSGFDSELESTWTSIDRELRGAVDQLLLHRLMLSASRRVPITALEAGPVKGVVRVRLADGVSVLARPEQATACTRLALAMARGTRVVLDEVRLTGEGVLVRTVLGRSGEVAARVVGFDQGD
ncbi:hypothetical protein [Tessaracoccus oleiagri]|uniref:Uncharacterized protein n=1 Tax=Tessaracoccus oleiagri TaxID=686624 RepID=A0A1G9L771_9ACTN|nr:hypothetical protein [Tessaracoccus oleiagri]SDL57781.1 hypothetical protein SAMN04488242_2075 [Tessaracoccus oleiagri]